MSKKRRTSPPVEEPAPPSIAQLEEHVASLKTMLKTETQQLSAKLAQTETETQQLSAKLAQSPSALDVEWDVRGVTEKLRAIAGGGQQVYTGAMSTVGGREFDLKLEQDSSHLRVVRFWPSNSYLPSPGPADISGTSFALLTSSSVSSSASRREQLGSYSYEYGISNPVTLPSGTALFQKGAGVSVKVVPLAALSEYLTEGDTLRIRATIRVRPVVAPFRAVTA